MAALSRRNPNLDDFVGLNWGCWVDGETVAAADVESDTEDSSKYGRNQSETMTLCKEDMHIYGHCPAHDDFYLVVCSHCGQVVKPEAFENHCERRHAPLTKTCGQSSMLAPQQRPRPGQPPVKVSSSRERQKDSTRVKDSGASASESPVLQNRPRKAQKEAVSLPSVEKFPQEKPLLPHNSTSTTRHRGPPWHSGPLPPGSSSTSKLERPSVQKSSSTPAPERPSFPKLSSIPTSERQPVQKSSVGQSKKECELNKHGRNVDPERKKLSSNTDASHQQQKPAGRPKPAEQLAVEHRKPSAGRDAEQLLVKLKDKEHLDVLEEKVTQGNRYNCHILGTRGPEGNIPEEEANSTVEVKVQPPYPFNQSVLSSEESDDEQEEATDLPASPWHPKPLGLCTFGCRTLGCSIFTFDRRLHHLRFALSAMLERHINAHLWKKMPPASSGLRSCHVTSPPVRNAARHFQVSGSLKRESNSQGKAETKPSHRNSKSTKPPSSSSSSTTTTSSSSANLDSGQWCNTVRRASKAQLKEAVLVPDASAPQKASRLPPNVEEKSSRYVRSPTLHEKQITSSHPGTASGTLSHGKKPCPSLPLQPTERHLSGLEKRSATTARSQRNRAKSQGIHQNIVSANHLGPDQKRKRNSESPSESSSLPRNSKSKRVSSPSRSSLLTWKGENIGGVVSWDLDKKPSN